MKQEPSYSRLEEYSIKPSVQRVAIMDFLIKTKTHPTVDEVHISLLPQMPMLSKTTVNNTLRMFVEMGAALMITINDKQTHYDANLRPHAHFLCKGCNCIYDIWEEIKQVIMVDNIGELTIDETHLYYKGYCPECLTKKNK